MKHVILSEIKSERERQIAMHFTYMWNLNNKTNEYKKREIVSQIQKTSGERGR